MRTVAFEPGSPLLLVICTPATCPLNAFVTFEVCLTAILSALIVEAEPVNCDFFAVPKATTITSSSSCVLA